jgi:hypothetical protein
MLFLKSTLNDDVLKIKLQSCPIAFDEIKDKVYGHAQKQHKMAPHRISF